jgi:ABC-type dipeptide/oligopeptide/nickel transport system permease component
MRREDRSPIPHTGTISGIYLRRTVSWQPRYTPVLTMYRERIGNTALLAACAVALGALVTIPLGTLAAYRRGSAINAVAQVIAMLG